MHENQFHVWVFRLKNTKYFVCEGLPDQGHAREVEHDDLEAIKACEQSLRLRSRHQIIITILNELNGHDSLG